jgi:hypothetical protein
METRRVRGWASWVLYGVLTVVTLDLTTSLIPSIADHLQPIAPPSGLSLWLRVLPALFWFVWTAKQSACLAKTCIEIGVPKPAVCVLGAFLLGASVHVVFRMEHYPFSKVGMFSSAVPAQLNEEPVLTQMMLLYQRDGQLHAVSFLREGSPLFGEFGFGWDYKAGWAMHMYALSYSSALDIVVAKLSEHGITAWSRQNASYYRKDGRLAVHLKPAKP